MATSASARQVEIPNAICPVCKSAPFPASRRVCLDCQRPFPAHAPGVPQLLPRIADAYEIVRRSVRIADLADGPTEVRSCPARRRHPRKHQQIPLKPAISSTRPRSLGTRPLSKKERRELLALEAEIRLLRIDDRRPRHGNGINGDCPPRGEPCPFVSCRHHLYLEEDPENGIVKVNFPGRDVDEIGETCSLREASRGAQEGQTRGSGNSVPRIGARLNLVSESVRKILNSGMKKLAIALNPDTGTDETDEFDDDDSDGAD